MSNIRSGEGTMSGDDCCNKENSLKKGKKYRRQNASGMPEKRGDAVEVILRIFQGLENAYLVKRVYQAATNLIWYKWKRKGAPSE